MRSIGLLQRARGLVRLAAQLYEGYGGRSAIALTLTFISSLFEAVGLASLLPLIDQIVADEGASSSFITEALADVFELFGLSLTAGMVIVAVTLLFALKGLADFGATYFRQSTGERFRAALIEDLFWDYGRADWGFVSRVPVGHSLNALFHETTSANQFLLQGLNAVSHLLYLLVLVAVASLVAPLVTIGSLVLLGTAGVIIAIGAPHVSRLGTTIVDSNRGFARYGTQFFSGAKTLKAYNSYEPAGELLREQVRRRANAHVRAKSIGAAVNAGIEFLLVTLVVVLIYVATQFATHTVAEVGVVAAIMYRVAQRARQLQIVTDLAEYIPALRSLVDAQKALKAHASSADTDTDPVPEQVVSVAFDDVSFAYSTSRATLALESVAFEITAGETVGVAGPSGAGKSTLTALLLGLLKPTDGSVTVNGLSLDELDLSDWRGRVGYVPQEAFLIDASVHDNISFFRDIDDDQVRRAARLANAADFIERLPEHYDTQVGDNGVSLSGGERQRLCLARALAGSPSLLVLDEATSSLDTEAELAIREALRNLRREVTIVQVAHRLSTLENADRIFVLERGRLIEQGSMPDLVSRGGRFEQLLRAQQSELA